MTSSCILSFKMDNIRLSSDLGSAIKAHRLQQRLKTTDIAAASGRSRDVLNRLERGEEVTVGSLMDILRAMGLALRLEPAGLPTLEEMQRRFGHDDDATA